MSKSRANVRNKYSGLEVGIQLGGGFISFGSVAILITVLFFV
jgi:hypothetical protein